ncbi:hypothetical protein ABEF95_010443 [Exophiala dermatitidis]
MSAQPAAAPTSAPSSTSSTKPPVTLDPTTHLDPGAYVRGTHGITIGEHTLIHPRVQLVAVRGPLSISDRCIIAEKSIIGGPIVQNSTSTTSATGSTNFNNKPETTTTTTTANSGSVNDEESDPVKTTISSNVYIHANSTIHAGATIQEAAVVEPHVTVLSGVTVGAHSKICAGVTVDRDVEEWTVVYGNGSIQRRRRKVTRDQQQPQQEGEAVDTDVVETMRLKAMDKEREGTVAILRMAARAATLAKKK